jgi:acetyl esterase/lipase
MDGSLRTCRRSEDPGLTREPRLPPLCRAIVAGDTGPVTVPLASWILLAAAVLGLLSTLTALLRATRLGWGNMLWFVSGWLASELAPLCLAASVVFTAGLALQTPALDAWPGRAGLVFMAGAWVGLAILHLRTRSTAAVLDSALASVLGNDYLDRIPRDRRRPVHVGSLARDLLRPVPRRPATVERIRDLRYGDEHPRQRLDLYRPAAGCTRAPVLLQIHGGGWVVGNKHEQALPLIHHLAQRGWIVVTPNYRLSPQARFPDHLVDCKRALAWTRRNVAHYGGDPGFIAVTGGSAGAHLAALVALTANRPGLQPGFEDVDTSVEAAVPLYGVYDFLDRHRLKGSGAAMLRWLERTVMPCAPSVDPSIWDLASPIALAGPGAPPFFVLHGTHDSLASVEEARSFVERLRAASGAPVVYAELPGAQHAWDLLRSVRALSTVKAVTGFLEWRHAHWTEARRAAAAAAQSP